MTLEKFRIMHSSLIEHYQFIEAHLEGIYASLSGKSLIAGLKDVEKDSMNHIIKQIKILEKQNSFSVFTDDEYMQLQHILRRRNFWCHNCYYDLVFDRKTGDLQKVEVVQSMLHDLQVAETWRDALFNKKINLFDSNSKSLFSSSS